MKKRLIFYAIPIALVIALIYLGLQHKQANKSVLPTEAKGPVIPAQTNQEVSLNSPPAANQPASASASLSQNKLWQQQMEKARPSLEVFSQQVHRPIEFYGRVMGEDNAPVGAANITFVWSHLFMPETTYSTNTLSDADGNFSIKGILGADLDVSVCKDGYFPVKSANPTRFSYSENFGATPFRPDPNNPVVFHLRKKGKGVELITSQNGMKPYLSVAAPLDGSPVFADLLNRKVGQTGQIEINQVKPDYQRWKQANGWQFGMTIPDGGFIEQSDEFPFEAPASGYQPTIQFAFQQGQTNWAINLNKDYYIKFGNPPLFGRLHLETSIDMSGARLTYAINPDGSRNLESQ
jgi:hypothetical protein